MAGASTRYVRSGGPRRTLLIVSLLAACTTADNAGPPKPVVSVAVTSPSDSLPVGTSLQLAATPKDAQGNPLSGRTITWSSSDPSVATVSASGLANGVALGTATLTAHVEGIDGGADVRVTAGPAHQLTFTSQPTALVAGVVISPPVVVTAQDMAGDVATSFSGSVTLSLGTNAAGATLLGTTTMAAINGVATFSDLHIDKSGAGLTLQAISGALNLSAETLLTQAGLIDSMVPAVPDAQAAADGAASRPDLPDTEDAIRADPRLSDEQKAALIAVYRSMLSAAPPLTTEKD